MIKETFKEVNSGIHVEIIDNGYTIEVNGLSFEGNYKTCKLYCDGIKELAEQLVCARDIYVS